MGEKSTDVVIVGGGIVGTALAYFLAREGVRPTLVEKDALGSHASGFAVGALTAAWSVGNPAAMAYASTGMQLHQQLAPLLREETGIDVHLHPCPTLRVALEERESQALQEEAALLQREGFSARWLSLQEAREVEPRLADEVLGGMLIPESFRVEPYQLVLALAQAAERLGAEVRHGQVVGLQWQGERVSGVVLSSGAVIPCATVVIAMGPWSAQAGAWLGLPVPVKPIKGQVVRVRLPGPPVDCFLTHHHAHAITKADGLVYLGATLEDAGFDEGTTLEVRDRILMGVVEFLPPILDAEVVQQTACLRPFSADGLPILGPVPGKEGVFIGTGGARVGIKLGPAMARALTDLILRRRTDLPLEPFLPHRFAGRERIDFIPVEELEV